MVRIVSTFHRARRRQAPRAALRCVRREDDVPRAASSHCPRCASRRRCSPRNRGRPPAAPSTRSTRPPSGAARTSIRAEFDLDVTGEKLDVLNASGEDVRFLSGRVPSLDIESSFGRAFPRFHIRGYGNTDFHPAASQPVSLIEEVVQENPMLKGFPVFDTERIGSSRGPGATPPVQLVRRPTVGKQQWGDNRDRLPRGHRPTASVCKVADAGPTTALLYRMRPQSASFAFLEVCPVPSSRIEGTALLANPIGMPGSGSRPSLDDRQGPIETRHAHKVIRAST